MSAGARTPEELETLLEDAFVLRDSDALAQLFHPDAMLASGDGLPEARGRDQITRTVRALWSQNHTYLADPRLIMQNGDTALILSGHAINVLARTDGQTWRYLICHLGLAWPRGWSSNPSLLGWCGSRAGHTIDP